VTKFNSYLTFAGNAEEAFNFYRGVFGGQFKTIMRFKDVPMPGVNIGKNDENKIMHIALPVGKDDILMASDALQSLGQKVVEGNNISISIFPDSKEEADKIFGALSAGGKIEMPLGDQSWGDYYGGFTDKFGVRWMVDYTYPKKELLISRIFEASRERVWKAWTEPEQIKKWWGPKTFTAPVVTVDFRVGGKYLYCMRSPDGKDYWSTGTFFEIVPLTRIVLTDSFADEKGNVVPASYYGMSADFPLESRVTLIFEDDGNKTKFTLKYDDVSKISNLQEMEQGWNESLDKLAEQLT
jgi:PhnB protein